MIGDGFAQILAAARTGADWAWTIIYRELAAPVHGYLRSRGVGDPEDLTGEVFLHVVRDLHSFTGDEREFRAWVFAIAHHRLIDAWRRSERRPVELSGDLATEVESGDAEEALLHGAAVDRVRRVLEQLTPEQRDVLLLRVFGDLTVGQVARLLGKSPGAVKALQRRGLETVASLLAQEGVTL